MHRLRKDMFREPAARLMAAAPLLLALVAGCASEGRRFTNEEINRRPDLSFVYGFMDMSDAPSRMSYFELECVAPKSLAGHLNIGVKDGVFFHLALPPGSYQLVEFGGMSGCMCLGWSLGGTRYAYQFPSQSGGFRLKEAGMHFVGSYRCLKAGTFFRPKFAIEPVDSPNEVEVLKIILPDLEGTKWHERAVKRIAKGGP